MIRFEQIEIKYGDFVAIRDLNLHIKEGEFFTFLGPSGCGKTTSCLLYTSPSPRDTERSRMPSSA